MSKHPFIVLAAAMRTALITPITATDRAAQTARLDIIDMIPDLRAPADWRASYDP
jgi:hypothetical protein